MSVNLSPLGGVAAQFFNNDGVPLAGGLIYTYAAGTNTPASTYTTGAGTIAHSNPIVLDSAGRIPTGEIWLTDGVAYKFVIKDVNLTLIGTYDNIVGINSNFVNYTSSQEIQTATAGQTVFTLTTMVYQPGTNSLTVFVDGVNQYGPGAQYAFVETSSTSVTFASGLHVGASVKFTTAVVNNIGGVDASQVTYDPPFSNSEVTNVEAKLAQFVTPEDFGAVGDGVADDTVAVQNAIDYCMTDPYNPKTLLLANKYYITASLEINDNLGPTVLRNNFFNIIGVGGGSGFYTDQSIIMFTASAFTGTQSVGRQIRWQNVTFEADDIATNVYVNDGSYIQIHLDNCQFTRVTFMNTSGVNTFSYWFTNCYIGDAPKTFFELIYTSANDVLFDGCYFNGTNGNAFPGIRLSLVQGFKCTNNTFESMDGTPIILRGSRSSEISGNYFEACGLIGATYYIDLNESGSAELSGVSISGNLLYMTSGQDADLAFYAINWDGVTAGSSNGNWCTGKLHKIVNAQPGYDLSINGDVQSTTGSSSGRAAIRPDRYFDLLAANNIVSTGNIANAYEQFIAQGNPALYSVLNTAVASTTGATIGAIVSKTVNLNGNAHAKVRFVTGPASWIKGEIWLETNPSDATNPAVATVPRLKVRENGSVQFVPLASAPSSPAEGDVYYNSTAHMLYCYDGTTWQALF